jgi:hypothetical protein
MLSEVAMARPNHAAYRAHGGVRGDAHDDRRHVIRYGRGGDGCDDGRCPWFFLICCVAQMSHCDPIRNSRISAPNVDFRIFRQDCNKVTLVSVGGETILRCHA